MPLLLLLLLAVPIVELWIIVRVSHWIGFGSTLMLLIAVSVAGAWLLKREGVAAWRRVQATLARGEMPTNEVTDGALILFGGALLLTPGFLTDGVGLALLLPPTRAIVKGAARRLIGWMASRRFGAATTIGRRVYTTTATRRPRGEGVTGAPEVPPRGPAREAGDGSQDTG